MNYLEISELVKRLEVIEETLIYWKTPSFTSSIEGTLYNIQRLEQEKENIKFQLEFPYLLLESLAQVEEIDGARIQVYKRQKDNLTAISVDFKGVYDYILINESTKECLEELTNFIHKCKKEELYEKEQKEKDIKLALNKLTDREKELLNLATPSDKNSQ